MVFRCYASVTSYKIVLALPMFDLQYETENEKEVIYTLSTYDLYLYGVPSVDVPK